MSLNKPVKKVRRIIPEEREPSTLSTASDLLTLQRRNAEKLMRQSLKKSDPLQGAVGVQASQLVMLGNHLYAALDDALGKAEYPLEEFDKQRTSLDTFLRINRQVDRFARLNHDLEHEASTAQKTQSDSRKDQSEELGS